MNKILKSLILLPILLFSFSVVSAVDIDQPLNCCILRSDVGNMTDDDGAPYLKEETVGGDDICALTSLAPDHRTKEWGLVCLLGSIGGVTHWVFIILMVVSPLMIIMGAYHIMTAGAEPDKVKTGKNYIIWAAVGLLVGLFSNAIPNFVASLIAG